MVYSYNYLRSVFFSRFLIPLVQFHRAAVEHNTSNDSSLLKDLFKLFLYISDGNKAQNIIA